MNETLAQPSTIVFSDKKKKKVEGTRPLESPNLPLIVDSIGSLMDCRCLEVFIGTYSLKVVTFTAITMNILKCP